jgi:hypothetical protein
MEKNLGAELEKKYANSKLILGIDNYQIYLNQNLIKEKIWMKKPSRLQL